MPRTNLVYANQQFFDGSRWQWTVPPLRADNALVNGPLPLMTLWRKERGLDAESVSHAESVSGEGANSFSSPVSKPRTRLHSPRGQAQRSSPEVKPPCPRCLYGGSSG